MLVQKLLSRLFRVIVGVCLVVTVAACTPPQPMAISHTHDSADGTHRGVQITMSTGVYNTPTQTVLLVYNKWTPTPVATVSGQSLRLSAQLVQALLNLGPAIVQGEYILQAERLNCPRGTLCGTLVQVSNQSGSLSNAASTAASGEMAPVPLLAPAPGS